MNVEHQNKFSPFEISYVVNLDGGTERLNRRTTELPKFFLRWSRPRCPELVAGSGKHVEVVMVAYDVQDVSTLGHVVVVGSLSQRLPVPDARTTCTKR